MESHEIIKRREFLGRCGAITLASAALPFAVPAPRRRDVNGARLNDNLARLGRIGRREDGGIWRVAFSEADLEARAFTLDLMRDAGLVVEIDPAGNILGLRNGSEPGLRPILFGSHIDSVPRGGNYDGPVGSYAAIEVAHTFLEAGYANRHPLVVTIWADEEGGLTGSRGYVDGFTQVELDAAGPDGRTLAEKLRVIGGRPERTVGGGAEPGSIAAYVELHIEQGAVLDERDIDIGVVEGIVGIQWHDVTFTGVPNHAGTTPMDRRHNAMLAAAELTLAVDRIVTSVPGRQVGTVGRVVVTPNTPNVVPGRVDLTVELRDLSREKIVMLWDRIRAAADGAARRFDVEFTFRRRVDLIPALSTPAVRDVIADVAAARALTTLRMPSGAGHDAQDLARLGPMGMIFVPSVGGISHAPDEFTRPEDIVNGANVLLDCIKRLDA